MENIKYRTPTIFDAQIMDTVNRRNLPENYNIDEWKIVLLTNSQFSVVAEHDMNGIPTVIGYCLGIKTHKKGIVASLAVDSQFRKSKIATNLLLQTILSFERTGSTAIELHVRKSNIPAQKLYHKLDFKEIGIEKEYYDDNEDAIIMVRKSKINF